MAHKPSSSSVQEQLDLLLEKEQNGEWLSEYENGLKESYLWVLGKSENPPTT